MKKYIAEMENNGRVCLQYDVGCVRDRNEILNMFTRKYKVENQ
jgi:hypothetical protein